MASREPRRGVAAVLSLVAMVVANGAVAQTEQPRDVTFNGMATLTSDYRFRGVSRSDRDPAAQASATVALRSGLYAGGFVSSTGRYVADGGDTEIDLFAGIRKTLGGTTIDGGLTYYLYPGTIGIGRNVFEPYLGASHTLGPVTARVGGDYAWRQRSLGLTAEKRSGLYGYGELSAGIPTTPFTVTGHAGRAFRADFATFGRSYTDWSLAAIYTRHRLSATLAYVDTDRTIDSRPFGGSSRNLAGAGVTGSVAMTF